MTRGLTSLGQALAWVKHCLGCVALIGLLGPAAAGAAVLAVPDARAVRHVVEAQPEAFAADDATGALSYASASIQAQFGERQTGASWCISGCVVAADSGKSST